MLAPVHRAVNRYDALVEALRREFPRFRIVRKDRAWLHRAIHHALIVLTLGRMRTYLDSYLLLLLRRMPYSSKYLWQ
jgi:hypothetical protein